MSKYLLIAGHGIKRNGGFDPGASGFIRIGEHNYMKNKLFPAMKKYANNDFIFHTSHNVFSYGDIVSLARKYGRDTKVIEFHFDASSNKSAKGGHVIVHKRFRPDKMDLRLRDVIDKHMGIRYNHRGHKGVSGRDNLANVNRTANGGVNYRLLELGFGTNKYNADVLLKNTDALARDLVKAIQGKSITNSSNSIPKPSKSINQLVKETIRGDHGNGQARRNSLGRNYNAVQKEINKLYK